MATSDSLAMLSSFSQLIAGLLIPPDSLHRILCACSEWTWRVSFCLSMYSWLCMSSLRYVAALRPLQYSTLGRGPLLGLCAVAIVAVVANLHLFVSTIATDVCVIQLNVSILLDFYLLYLVLVNYINLRFCGCFFNLRSSLHRHPLDGHACTSLPS